jgi:hypothetical protein
MKKIVKVFIALSIVFAIFTGVQYFGKSSPVLMKMERATVKVDRGVAHPPRPTAADLQRVRAEATAAEAELRKEKREDMKMYLGFAGTILSTLTTIILAIINRKKD